MDRLIDIIVYVVLGSALSWIFYYYKRKDLLGGFAGGLVVAVLGAVLGVLILSKPAKILIAFLQKGMGISDVDVLTGAIVGYGALYVYNRINHDRTRQV